MGQGNLIKVLSNFSLYIPAANSLIFSGRLVNTSLQQ